MFWISYVRVYLKYASLVDHSIAAITYLDLYKFAYKLKNQLLIVIKRLAVVFSCSKHLKKYNADSKYKQHKSEQHYVWYIVRHGYPFLLL